MKDLNPASFYHGLQNLKKAEMENAGVDEMYEFMCPITGEILLDPVITSDGHTYSRAAIVKWFEQNRTSPLTGARLPNLGLLANYVMRKAIEEAREKQRVNLRLTQARAERRRRMSHEMTQLKQEAEAEKKEQEGVRCQRDGGWAVDPALSIAAFSKTLASLLFKNVYCCFCFFKNVSIA
jgi:hypothetical protein